MQTRAFGLLAGLVLVSASLTGCASLDPGPRATEQREIEDVSVVELDTSGSVNVTLGTKPSLTITAAEKVIDRLTADVDSGVLHLGSTDEDLGYPGEIRYELVVSTLSSLTVRGSGDASVDFTGEVNPEITVRGSGSVDARGIDGETVTLTLEGSGDIDVADATAQRLQVRIDGSGGVRIGGAVADQAVELRGSATYSASDLQSTDARIAAHGSGEATVSVSGTLDAVVDGSSEVIYSGDARVTKNVSGSGELLHDGA